MVIRNRKDSPHAGHNGSAAIGNGTATA